MRPAFALLTALCASMLVVEPLAGQRWEAENAEFAPYVLASQQLRFEGRATRIDFIVRDEVPILAITRGRSRESLFLLLSGPDQLLLLLADRRFEPLWPAMIEWAGPGLERAARSDIDLARAVYDGGGTLWSNTTAQSSTRPRIRALLQYARALQHAGRVEDATVVLRNEISTMPLDTEWGQAEATMLRLQLVHGHHENGDSEAALAELRQGEDALRGTSYAVNFTVNRAATLAEIGRYAEALAAIEAARQEFDTLSEGEPGEGSERIPGSDRQFAWIRACALHGLGRAAEAAELMRQVRAAREPRDAFFVVSSNFDVQLRADICMGNREAVVLHLLNLIEEDPLIFPVGHMLQPNFLSMLPGFERTMRDVRVDPRIVASTRERMRELPPDFAPALRHWNSRRGRPASEIAT